MSLVAIVRMLLKPLIGLSIILGVSITPGEIAKFNTTCVSFITHRIVQMVMVMSACDKT